MIFLPNAIIIISKWSGNPEKVNNSPIITREYVRISKNDRVRDFNWLEWCNRRQTFKLGFRMCLESRTLDIPTKKT